MKPHEETWEIRKNPYGNTVASVGPLEAAGEDGHGLHWIEGPADALSLAAQAPAMARLLLEWSKFANPHFLEEIDDVLRAAGVIP